MTKRSGLIHSVERATDRGMRALLLVVVGLVLCDCNGKVAPPPAANPPPAAPSLAAAPPVAAPAIAPSPRVATSARPMTERDAIRSALAKDAPTPELAELRWDGINAFLGRHLIYLESRMKARGKLPKGERIYDETGKVRSDRVLDLIEFTQQDLYRFHGTNDYMTLLGRIDGSGEMSLVVAAGLLRLNIPEIRASLSTAAPRAPATATP